MNNNLAFFVQKSQRQCEQAKESLPFLKKAISITKKQMESIEVSSEKDILLKVKYLYSLISNLLQSTACHSQTGNHSEALKNGKKCLRHFKFLGKLILNYIEQLEEEGTRVSDVSDLSIVDDMKSFLGFILKVVECILGELEFDSISRKQQFQQLEGLVFETPPRKINIGWAKSLFIAYFMHIQYVTLRKVNHEIHPKEIFSSTFFSLMVLMSASLLFMISTENRLICLEEHSMMND